MKRTLSRVALTVFIVVTMFLPFLRVSAATFALTKIGALDLGANKFNEWWYTGINPTLVGTAAAGEVKIVVDDKTYTTNANTNGDWSYYLALGKGDYGVVINQGSNSYTFKLHLGQNVPGGSGTASQTSESSVPTTGSDQIVALGLGLGISLLALYLYISGDTNGKNNLIKRSLLRE